MNFELLKPQLSRSLKIKIPKSFAISLQVISHFGAVLPLFWLYFAVSEGQLGGDPVKEIIHFLGMGALRLMLLSLCISGLAKLIGGHLNRLRRPLGIWCFVWTTLHIMAWSFLDLGFDWQLIFSEIFIRQYILVGFIVWLVLLIMTITSIPVLVRKMKGNWKKIHGAIYLSLILACLHFWWSQKSGWQEPFIYSLIASGLLVWRKEKIFRWYHSIFKVKPT